MKILNTIGIGSCLAIVLSILLASDITGQSIDRESINTSGANMAHISGSLSWTLGQFEQYIEDQPQGPKLHLGHQQGNLVLTTSIVYEEGIETIIAYPNPTIEHLIIENQSSISTVSNLKYELWSMDGKRYMQGLLMEDKCSINMSNLSTGTYVLKIFRKSNLFQSFKILKP